MTIQMKATEKYFPVVLFVMLYKLVLTLESVDEIATCDYSSESHCVLSCDALLCCTRWFQLLSLWMKS